MNFRDQVEDCPTKGVTSNACQRCWLVLNRPFSFVWRPETLNFLLDSGESAAKPWDLEVWCQLGVLIVCSEAEEGRAKRK